MMAIFYINGNRFDATIIYSKNQFASVLHTVFDFEKNSGDRLSRHVAVNDELYQVIEKINELNSVKGILSSLGSGFVKMLFGNMSGGIDASHGLYKAFKSDQDLRSFLRDRGVDEIVLRFSFDLKGRNIDGYNIFEYGIPHMIEGTGG